MVERSPYKALTQVRFLAGGPWESEGNFGIPTGLKNQCMGVRISPLLPKRFTIVILYAIIENKGHMYLIDFKT